MREILFRGKRVDNGEWAEGNLFIPDKVTRADVPTEILMGTNIVRISLEVDPATIGQYTGLTDKNGVKIFEGDILCVPEEESNTKSFAIVKFGEYDDVNAMEDDHFVGWFLSFKAGLDSKWTIDVSILNGQSDDMLAIKMSEVIGNIHDNPELLEVRP